MVVMKRPSARTTPKGEGAEDTAPMPSATDTVEEKPTSEENSSAPPSSLSTCSTSSP